MFRERRPPETKRRQICNVPSRHPWRKVVSTWPTSNPATRDRLSPRPPQQQQAAAQEPICWASLTANQHCRHQLPPPPTICDQPRPSTADTVPLRPTPPHQPTSTHHSSSTKLRPQPKDTQARRRTNHHQWFNHRLRLRLPMQAPWYLHKHRRRTTIPHQSQRRHINRRRLRRRQRPTNRNQLSKLLQIPTFSTLLRLVTSSVCNLLQRTIRSHQSHQRRHLAMTSPMRFWERTLGQHPTPPLPAVPRRTTNSHLQTGPLRCLGMQDSKMVPRNTHHPPTAAWLDRDRCSP